jgi:RNA polymerase sigma factor (sigma-70 family)
MAITTPVPNEAQLLKENDGLAYKIALRFIRMGPIHQEYAADIHQAAKIGLLHAIRKWDPSKGALSTVANFSITHEICNFLDDNRLVRMSKGALQQARSARKKLDAGSKLTVDEQLLLDIASPTASSDAPLPGGEGATFIDVTPGSEAFDPYNYVADSDAARAVREAVARLPLTKRRAIEAIYPFGTDEDPATFAAAGARLGLTKAGARFSCNAAMKSLRQDPILKVLAGR